VGPGVSVNVMGEKYSYPCWKLNHVVSGCEIFHNELLFTMGVVSSPPNPQSWRTTHYRLLVTDYSIYL
jgi:hypothetical protein